VERVIAEKLKGSKWFYVWEMEKVRWGTSRK
jgi:hypothetical protein